MKKTNIWLIGIGAFVLAALLGAFVFIYTKKDKDFNIDGQYQAVQTDGGFGVNSFSISGNHLIFDGYDFYINKISDATFAIKSFKDTIYLKYKGEDQTLELSRNGSSALYININNLSTDLNFSQSVYMDLDAGSAIILQDNHTLIRQNMNSGEIAVLNYECSDLIIRLTDVNAGNSEYYYYENSGDMVMYDLQWNKTYDYYPADKEYTLSGYKDLMDNKTHLNLSIDECRMAEFGEYRFLISDGRMYQAVLLDDSIAVKYNGEDYYFYQVKPQEGSALWGNYTTNDALGMLILRNDGTGNLTLDMKGLNFRYTAYDKYLKCVDNGGIVFLIPYSISDTGMELTITIENESSSKRITFYRLRDIPES